jgi:hypothetical protein
MKRFLVIALMALFVLPACSMINEPPRLYSGMSGKAPEGTPLFRKAWQEGCETGLKVSGNTHYKFVHKFHFDANYIENDEYNEGWYLGFDYCRWRVSSWQRKGGA